MPQNVDIRTPKRSTDSSRQPVDSAILKALSSGPISASTLKQKVIDSTGCSQAQYYKRLAELRDKRREVIFAPKGRERYYALYQDKDRLGQYLKGGGALEQFTIKTALNLRDYMMTEARYDPRNIDFDTTLHIRFRMFLDTLSMLRKTYPNIPAFRPPKKEDPLEAIRAEYRYVLDILEFFKAL